MSNNITISAASEQDIPALCELLDLLFSQEAEFRPDSTTQQRGLREIIFNPSIGQILVAKSNEAPVGMVNLLFSASTALGTRVAWLEDLIVHPNWRMQGIGSKLLQTALDYCLSKNVQRITLLTDADNLAAQRFYRTQGFYYSSMVAMRCSLNQR